MYGFLWVSMGIYGYICVYFGINRYVWVCMSICGYVYEYIWVCQDMYGYIWIIRGMYGYSWVYIFCYFIIFSLKIILFQQLTRGDFLALKVHSIYWYTMCVRPVCRGQVCKYVAIKYQYDYGKTMIILNTMVKFMLKSQ